MSVPVLVAVAWPYASGSRHLGHLSGAYLPADVFAPPSADRGQRGADGQWFRRPRARRSRFEPTVRESRPAWIVERYHSEFVRQWDELGFSWDLFTTTGTENHARVTQEMFLGATAQRPHRPQSLRTVLRPRGRTVPAGPLHRRHMSALRLCRGPCATSATTAAGRSTH